MRSACPFGQLHGLERPRRDSNPLPPAWGAGALPDDNRLLSGPSLIIEGRIMEVRVYRFRGSLEPLGGSLHSQLCQVPRAHLRYYRIRTDERDNEHPSAHSILQICQSSGGRFIEIRLLSGKR